jgi:flagellar hook-basal body complex protein FliE
MPTPLGAANAYASLAKITSPGAGLGKVAGGAGAAAGTDFGSVLKQALGSVVEAGRKSDAQTQALAAGKANMVDVVTAVAETEVAVDALVSVRDKVIQAYEEIMRMPI